MRRRKFRSWIDDRIKNADALGVSLRTIALRLCCIVVLLPSPIFLPFFLLSQKNRRKPRLGAKTAEVAHCQSHWIDGGANRIQLTHHKAQSTPKLGPRAGIINGNKGNSVMTSIVSSSCSCSSPFQRYGSFRSWGSCPHLCSGCERVQSVHIHYAQWGLRCHCRCICMAGTNMAHSFLFFFYFGVFDSSLLF